MTAIDPHEDRGFTLVEVLVALTILGLSLAVLLHTISSGLDASRRAKAQTIAAAHAQNLLDQAGVTLPLDKPLQTGSFPDGALWQLRIEPFGSEEDQAAWPAGAVKVTVEVGGTDGQGAKPTKLSALRIVPKSAR